MKTHEYSLKINTVMDLLGDLREKLRLDEINACDGCLREKDVVVEQLGETQRKLDDYKKKLDDANLGLLLSESQAQIRKHVDSVTELGPDEKLHDAVKRVCDEYAKLMARLSGKPQVVTLNWRKPALLEEDEKVLDRMIDNFRANTDPKKKADLANCIAEVLNAFWRAC